MSDDVLDERAAMKRMLEAWDRLAGAKTTQCMDVRDEANIKRLLEGVLKAVDTRQDMILLDICCGDGSITNRIARRVRRVMGIDFSSNMVKEGMNSAAGNGLGNADYLRGIADALPFKDDIFDATLCLGALYYLPSEGTARNAVDEMIRVTKKDGKVLITDLPLKYTFAYWFWNIIRNRRVDVDYETFGRETHTFVERLNRRVRLLARRFHGKRVISDGWLWLSPSFFEGYGSGKFRRMKVSKSGVIKGLNYKFDVLLYN